MELAVRKRMARRAAREINHGDIVNLGIGIPTLVSEYIDGGKNIFLHTENGLLGVGPDPLKGCEDEFMVNAGGLPCTHVNGASFFDTAQSFAIIRSGRLDVTILGTLEVDQQGNLANWIIPGKLVPGIGGAMELAQHAKKVVILTTHVNKKGISKIKKVCTLPLTAPNCVDLIITDLAVMRVVAQGLVLEEIFNHTTVEEVIAKTEADLIVENEVKILE